MAPILKSMKYENKEVILLLLLFMVGFSIPFSYGLNSICFGALSLYSFVWFNKNDYIIFDRKVFFVHLLFVVFFFIQFIGVFYSKDRTIGFLYLKQNIVFLLLPIVFINLSKILDARKVKMTLYGLLFGVTIILLSIHIKIVYRILLNDLNINSLFNKYVRMEFVQEGIVELHPPYFGLLVVFCIISVYYITFSSKKKYNGLIKLAFIFYFLISLYGIASFMSFVLVFVVFVFFLIKFLKKRKIKYTLIFLGASMILILCISKIDYRSVTKNLPGHSILGRIEWSFFKGKGDTSRPDNWKSVVLVIKDNPLKGIGSDGGLNELQKHRGNTTESFVNRHNAHNQYLEVFLRHGIFGLIIYFTILYSLMLCAIKSKDGIFQLFLIVFIIACITESYLVRQIGLSFFTFYALLFYTLHNFNSLKIRDEKGISS